MVQHEIIQRIVKGLFDDNCLLTAYYEEIANQYDSIKLFVVIPSNCEEQVKMNIIKYLEVYNSLVYFEANQEMVVAVYENAIKVTLVYLSSSDIKVSPSAHVLYDPDALLENVPSVYTMTNEEIGKMLDVYSGLVLSFRENYTKKNYVLSLKIASDINGILSTLLRFVYDPQNAKLSSNGLMAILPNDIKNNYSLIINKLKIDSSYECMKMMSMMVDTHIVNMPIEIVQYINIDYYFIAKSAILNS